MAACVMTFEARDSAAKVVPARLKVAGPMPMPGTGCGFVAGKGGLSSHHSSLRTAGSQTATFQYQHHHQSERRALTQSFVQFSRGLAMEGVYRNISPQVGVTLILWFICDNFIERNRSMVSSRILRQFK